MLSYCLVSKIVFSSAPIHLGALDIYPLLIHLLLMLSDERLTNRLLSDPFLHSYKMG